MAKTNIIPSAPFAISLGGDPNNYIIIEDGKISFAIPNATRIVVSDTFANPKIEESFPTLPRENITIEHEEVLAARGLSQPLTERFILLNLQNKYFTTAVITQDTRNKYSWQSFQRFWDRSLADIVRRRFNIDMSEDDLADLARHLENFREGKATDRILTLSGKYIHEQFDVEVMESLEVLSARCTANAQDVAERILEFVKQCKESHPEAFYLTGKLHLYPDFQNALEKEMQGFPPIVIPENAEDALQRGMALYLLH